MQALRSRVSRVGGVRGHEEVERLRLVDEGPAVRLRQDRVEVLRIFQVLGLVFVRHRVEPTPLPRPYRETRHNPPTYPSCRCQA